MDEILITAGDEKEICELKSPLQHHFLTKYIGSSHYYFLGIEVTRFQRHLSLR